MSAFTCKLKTCWIISGLAVASLAVGTVIPLQAMLPPEDGLIPINDRIAAQYDLRVQWRTNVRVARQTGVLAEVILNVNENRARTIYEVDFGEGGHESYAENDMNPFGVPFTVESAREWAELRKQILEAKGYSVSIEKYVLPESTIFALTTDGQVQSIDGETGKTNWAVTVGKPQQPAQGIAANNDFVGVVSGPFVFCLDAKTGQTRWTRICDSAPSGGVAISDNFIFVTQITGVVQAFPLNEDGIPDRRLVSYGGVVDKPHISGLTLSWPTNRNYYMVASALNPDSIAFYLETNSPILVPGTSAGGNLIVTTEDGKVFSLNEKRGTLNWELALGSPINERPVAFGNSLFVISDVDRLFKIDAATGQFDPNWPRGINGIVHLLGASQSRAYFIDHQFQLVSIDRETGSQLGRFFIGNPDFIVTNEKTDRIYLATTSGKLICLRESSNFYPFFHQDADEVAAQVTQPAIPGPAVEERPAQQQPNASDNPFGGDDSNQNPFGGGGDDSNQNPFDGRAQPPAENPFG